MKPQFLEFSYTAAPKQAEEGGGMKAYWQLVLRDSALLWVITFWGAFSTRAYIGYLQSFNREPNLSPLDISAIGLFATAPVGFCIIGCLTKTHRFRHLLIVT